MKPFDKEELVARLKNLLTLRQQIQAKYASSPISQIIIQKEKTIDDLFLEKLHSSLETHYEDSGISIQQVAKSMNMSYNQFNRKLKALTNQTPAKYLRTFRLEKAKKLLINPANDLNVAEVAYQVGFTDPNYFSRCFGELFGRSPNAIRRCRKLTTN